MEYHNKGICIFTSMIVLVGPGIMTIPPPGWGAVEILIWEYYQELKAQGHHVVIVNPIRTSPYDQQPNTSYSQALIQEINAYDADVVHIHYDCLHYILPFLTCPRLYITSHFPYIGNTEKYGGYHDVFHALCKNDRHSILAVSTKDYDIFKAFALHPEKVFYTPNGCSPIPPLNRPGLYLDKSIYVAKVEPRKKQHLYCCIPNIDFYGKCDDSFRTLSCYKGEKEHGEMVNLMREYGSLVLLSDGENGGPLVIKEALMAGIPVVTNQYSGMEPMPFIDIIPEERLHDMAYIQEVIEKSRTKDRTGIREYASQFSWPKLVKDYTRFTSITIIPIGPNCKVAQTLQDMKIRQASFPWDWIRDTSVRDIIDVLKQNQFDVRTWNKIQTMEYSMPHDYKEDIHNKHELLFEGGDLLSKYERRFKRFFEKIKGPCYFVRFGDGTDLQELQTLVPHATIIHIPDGHPDSLETKEKIRRVTHCKEDRYGAILRDIVVHIIEKNAFPIHSDVLIERFNAKELFTEPRLFDKSELLSFLFLRIKEITGIEYPLH